MRILLDECLAWDFRHCFGDHECHTSQYAGLKGKSNGELLSRAEALGSEVLVTVDRGMQYQQSMAGRKISVLALKVRSNQISDLEPMTGPVLKALAVIGQGEFLLVLAEDEAH